jgi:hypothetical protein
MTDTNVIPIAPRLAGHERLCLNEVWRAGGSKPGYSPAQWAERPRIKDFIRHLQKKHCVPLEQIIRMVEAKPIKLVYACASVALQYGGTLCPVHRFAQDSVIARMMGSCDGYAEAHAFQRANGEPVPRMVDEFIARSRAPF